LQKRELIEICKSSADARAREISLTRQGKREFRDAARLWRKAQKNIVKQFGEANWRELENTLLKLRQLVV